MYAWIFRKLPGPLWLRTIQATLLIALAVLALMNYVFPWASQYSPWTDSTVAGAELQPLQAAPGPPGDRDF